MGQTMRLYMARDIREADRIAIEEMGIPSLALMENAARAITRALIERVPELLAGRVAILCGKGNNGGDGLAVARLLRGAGFDPEVWVLADPHRLSPDAQAQFERVRAGGVPCTILSEKDLPLLQRRLGSADLVLDALLGTGLGGPASGFYAGAIRTINESGAFVAALDIPSGLSGDAFAPAGSAVRADLTLTLALPKIVLYTPEGAKLCGEVCVLDIGLPTAAVEGIPCSAELLDRDWARPFFEHRRSTAHKGDLGCVLLIAGGRGKSGAALLAARGALRAGAGLVTVACPASSCSAVIASLPEAMSLPLPETEEGTLSMDALMPLLDACEGMDAVGMGPGLGQTPETSALCRELHRRIPCPAVLDADALNAFAGREGDLPDHPGPRVLTPHPGEMARLCGWTVEEVVKRRYTLVWDRAQAWNAAVLLKGYRTLLAAPERPWRMNLSGGPHMAGPGFGDVLTGVVAALLARRMDPFDATSLAAWWHGASGDRAAVRLGGYGLLASECADALPPVEGETRA